MLIFIQILCGNVEFGAVQKYADLAELENVPNVYLLVVAKFGFD